MHARAIPLEALDVVPEYGRELVRTILLMRWGTVPVSGFNAAEHDTADRLVAAKILVVWPGLEPPPATDDKEALARRRRDLPYGPRVTLSAWVAARIEYELGESRLEGPLRWFGPGERRPRPLLRKLAGFVALPFPDRIVAAPAPAPGPGPDPQPNPLIARLARLSRLASSMGPLRPRSRSHKPTRRRPTTEVC
jgi:hypothetical protein